MVLLPNAALWFLPIAGLLSLAAVWTDLSRMKIPNWVTDALLIAFIPLGLIALPWQDFMWQLLNPVVMFAIGLVLHSIRAMGGGDIKFLIAASPYVMVADLKFVIFMLMGTIIAGLIIHRLMRATVGPKLAPDWVSWDRTGRYPLGFSLGPALILYLVLAALQ